MVKIAWATMLVLLVIYAVPFVVYGLASVVGKLRPPETTSPSKFLLGVLITKLGTAITFVAILAAGDTVWGRQWLAYAAVWFVMFALSEVGEATSGRTSSPEAVLGVVSEAIYTPAAAFIAHWVLGHGAA